MGVVEVRLTATIAAGGTTVTKRCPWPVGGGMLRRAIYTVPALTGSQTMTVALKDDLGQEQHSKASLPESTATVESGLAVPLVPTVLARTTEAVAPGAGLNLVLTNSGTDAGAITVSVRLFIEM